METTSQLLTALKEAGLEDETLRLIVQNRLVAEAIVAAARAACGNLRYALFSNGQPCHRPYAGKKINLGDIPAAMVSIRARSRKVTQVAVAKELGCKPNTLVAAMRRNHDVREAYNAALRAHG